MKIRLKHKNIFLRIFLVPIFFGVWQLCFYFDLFEGQIPSVISVFKVFLVLDNVSDIIVHLSRTLYIFIQCLIFGGIIGYSLGIFMGVNKWFKIVFYNFLNAIKSIPVTILIPIAIIVFKLSNFLVPLLSLPVAAIIAVNMADACENSNKNRQGVLSLINVNRYAYFTHILFFETLEVLFSTLRIIVTYIIALEIAFDYFLNLNKGIGFYIYNNYQGDISHLPKMYAGILIVAILGIGIVKALDIISKKSITWKKQI